MDEKVFVAERKSGNFTEQCLITHCNVKGGRNAAARRISAVLCVSRANIREIGREAVPPHLNDLRVSVTEGVAHTEWVGKPVATARAYQI